MQYIYIASLKCYSGAINVDPSIICKEEAVIGKKTADPSCSGSLSGFSFKDGDCSNINATCTDALSPNWFSDTNNCYTACHSPLYAINQGMMMGGM